MDFEKRQVTLDEGTKKDLRTKEMSVSYDLLVGADGVNSRTRTLLSNYLNKKGEDFIVKTINDTMEYQVAMMPKPWKEFVQQEKLKVPPLDTCPSASLQSWSDTKLGITALGFPTRESSKSPINKCGVCVICPVGMLGEMKKSGASGYTLALSTLFADWKPECLAELAQLLAQEDNVPSTGGLCVWSQALSHPDSGVVLVGDAGHGMWPSLGQGCNAALESVSGECYGLNLLIQVLCISFVSCSYGTNTRIVCASKHVLSSIF